MVTINGDKFPGVTKICASILKEETFTILDNKYDVPKEIFFNFISIIANFFCRYICTSIYFKRWYFKTIL